MAAHSNAPATAAPHAATRPSVATATPALTLDGVFAGYGRTTVLRDASVTLPAGEVLAVLGANGVGKTTLLRTVSGLINARGGVIRLDGQDVTRARVHQRVRQGLCLIPEGRGIFRGMTVAENLKLHFPRWVDASAGVEKGIEAFPVLKTRLGQTAGSLSGGQQQMLAIARAFVCDPKVVMLDEVSMGLAPILVDQIFEALKRLATSGISMVLVEQYVHRALDIADRVAIMDKGTVIQTAAPGELGRDEVIRHYLGNGVA